MAKDWAIAPTLRRARQALRCDIDNTAPIPIAIALEANETGEWQWTVDLIVRTDDYEVDATASHEDPAKALKNAYLRFCRSHTFLLQTSEEE